MHASAMASREIVALAVGLCSLLLYVAMSLLVQLLLRRGRRRGWVLCAADILRWRMPAALPPPLRRGLVSILKPLSSEDDGLTENLASFAKLGYPELEILFGVAHPNDPAVPHARAFIARHPEVEARIVVTDPDAAMNPKVAQLIGLAAAARGAIFVISDSNVRVDPDYVEQVVRPLDDPRCGVVSSLFSGTGELTVGAALENLQLCAVVTPFVVLSTLGPTVTIGKSMAMRRRDLDELGGFGAFRDVLAEDLMLGQRFLARGQRIATSFHQVENRNVQTSVGRMFGRHARWAKMRRVLAPTCFALELMLSPVLIVALGVLLAPGPRTGGLLLLAALLQTFFAWASTTAIRGHAVPLKYAPLELVRVVVMFGCWLEAWASREVVWRGHALTVGAGTVVTPSTRRRTRAFRLPG